MNSSAAGAIVLMVTALTLILASHPAFAANDKTPVSKSKPASHRAQSTGGASDPSIGASCAYDRAAGRCMIDLGNGRCMDCNAGPMK